LADNVHVSAKPMLNIRKNEHVINSK